MQASVPCSPILMDSEEMLCFSQSHSGVCAMFTTMVLKYGTTFANLFVICIAVSHFVIGILLLAFHENKPVKMILLAVRGIMHNPEHGGSYRALDNTN